MNRKELSRPDSHLCCTMGNLLPAADLYYN